MFTDATAITIFKMKYEDGRRDMLKLYSDILLSYSSRRYNGCLSKDDIKLVIRKMEEIEKLPEEEKTKEINLLLGKQ